MNSSETLNYLLRHAQADVQLCAAAFAVISGAPEEEQPELFKTFVCRFGDTSVDHALDLPNVVDEGETLRGMIAYGKKVDSCYEELQEKMLPERELYRQLWNYIRTSPDLPDENARIIGLYDMAVDKRFPYYPIDRSAALTMDPLEYNDAVTEIGEETLGELKFTLNADFEQRTERASMVLRLMDRFPDAVQKTVLLSRVIAFYEKEIDRLRFAGIFDDV